MEFFRRIRRKPVLQQIRQGPVGWEIQRPFFNLAYAARLIRNSIVLCSDNGGKCQAKAMTTIADRNAGMETAKSAAGQPKRTS